MSKTDYNKIQPTVSADSIVTENSSETVVQAITQAQPQKPPIHRRINKFVFGNEGFKGVASGIVHNVFIPVIKRAILDTGYSVLNRIIYPNGGHHPGSYPPNYNSYNSYMNTNFTSYNTPNRTVTRVTSAPSIGSAPVQYNHQYDNDLLFEIQTFDTKEIAERVLISMLDIIDRSHRITLGEYLTMCGYKPDMAKWSYGWTELPPTTKVVPNIEGRYYIDLPKPVVL